MDKIYFVINNVRFELIEEAQLSRSLDSIAGAFEVILPNISLETFPIKNDDLVKIFVGDKKFLTGYVTTIDANYSSSRHDVSISGNCKTIDLVDSSISTNASIATDSLLALCELVIKNEGLNINVIDERNKEEKDFPADEVKNGEAGESVIAFLQRYAIKANAMLTSNGNGDLVIYSNKGINVGASITIDKEETNNQVISSMVRKDYSRRFKKVIVRSQLDDLAGGGDDIVGEATDDEISRNRTKVIISESIMDINTAKKVAEWEVNKRRSDSVSYNCQMLGYRTFIDKGTIYEPSQLISVNDIFAGIDATMMIRAVKFNYGATGSLTNLELVASDSYTLKTEASQFAKGV